MPKTRSSSRLSGTKATPTKITRLAKVETIQSPKRTPSKKLKQQTNSTKKTNTPPTQQSQGKLVNSPPDLFRNAKSVFRKTFDHKLIGRDHERQTIQNFLNNFLQQKQYNALYISGLPGTGKTALVKELLVDVDIEQRFINCMNIDSGNLFNRISDEFRGSSNDFLAFIRGTTTTKSDPILLVLDEIDSLLTKENNVLYTLFDWANRPNSNLCLIGIANTLDLTERFLPRLKAKNCEPVYLNFEPYKVDEIAAIIKARLRLVRQDLTNTSTVVPMKRKPSASPLNLKNRDQNAVSPSKKVNANTENLELGKHNQADQEELLMHPRAIELCARKLASTGDLRKALDVCRQAIQLVENESKESTTIPQVTIQHILKASKSMLGNSLSERLSQMQVHGKICLLVLTWLKQQKQSNTFSNVKSILTKVEKSYRLVCSKQSSLKALTSSEFKDTMDKLCDQGFVRFEKKKQDILVEINVHDVDLMKSVKDNAALTDILEENGKCLVR